MMVEQPAVQKGSESEATGKLRALLQQAVAEGVAPGASAWVWHDGRVVASACAGSTRLHAGIPVTERTHFDIASLTKPATAALASRLVATGVLEPGSVATAPGTRSATLEQVLAHEAGFEHWAPLHESVPAALRGSEQARRIIIDGAMTRERVARPGEVTIYSDLGFIALVPVLERAAGATLESAIRSEVLVKLGLDSTGYRAVPDPGPEPREGIAATEIVPERGGLIHGQVHDDNAHAMGGVSTHAGLFATARDVGTLAVAFLEAARGNSAWLPGEVARWATTPLARDRRTPGWDVRSTEYPSSGSRFGPRSFGHLGFTGCSVWADPDERLVAVLLTNRVHPTRNSESIRAFRPIFHDFVWDLT